VIECLVAFTGVFSAQAQELIPYRKGDLWGYVDSAMNIKFPIEYDRVERFDMGIAQITKDRKTGLINEKLEVLIPVSRMDISGTYCGNFTMMLQRDKPLTIKLYRLKNGQMSILYLGGDSMHVKLVNNKGEFMSKDYFTKFRGIKDGNRYEFLGCYEGYKNGKHIRLDQYGNEIPSLGYDRIFSNRGNTFSFSKDSLIGLIDTLGQVILPCQLESISAFGRMNEKGLSYASATKNGKKGLVDNQGNIVIPFEYESAYHYKGIFGIKKHGEDKYKYLNAKKEVIPNVESEKFPFPSENYIPVCKNNKWGIVDRTTLELVIPHQYDAVREVTLSRIQIKVGEKYGMIDLDQNLLIDTIYDSFYYPKEGNVIHVRKAKREGLIDLDGQIILPAEYNRVQINKDKSVTFTKGRASGYYFPSTKKMTPLKYYCKGNHISHNGYIPVKTHPKLQTIQYISRLHGMFHGIIDSTGEEIIPCKYYRIKTDFIDDNFLMVGDFKYNAMGLINFQGDTILPFKYIMIHKGVDNTLVAKFQNIKRNDPINNQYFKVTKNKITEVKYEKTYEYSDGLSPAKQNDKWGYINEKKEFIIQAIYDKTYPFERGYARVELNKKWGYINKKGVQYFSD